MKIQKRIPAQNTSKMLLNLSFKRKNIHKGIFHINNYLQRELCGETYDFKKYKNMKLINRHSSRKKSLKTAPCQEDWPKNKELTVSKHHHVHKVKNNFTRTSTEQKFERRS